MDDKKYFEDLDLKTFSEQDWQDIFDLLERNPEKFRAMFRDGKVATESEITLRQFLDDTEREQKIADRMVALDKAGAPESVKEFWAEFMSEQGGDDAEYKPVAERMKKIDAFWNKLHELFDCDLESEQGDINDPFSDQYLTPELEPPIFKRNRVDFTTHERITLIFTDGGTGFSGEHMTELAQIIMPWMCGICAKGRNLVLTFDFADAYTESELEQN